MTATCAMKDIFATELVEQQSQGNALLVIIAKEDRVFLRQTMEHLEDSAL